MNYTQLISSSISGLVEILIIHPIDYYKTKRQVNIKNINIYSGIYPRLIGVIPMRMIFWSSISYFNEKKVNPLLSGFYTSVLQTAIDYPVEQIKIQQMNNIKPINAFRNINLKGAISSHLLRNSIFAMSTSYVINKYRDDHIIISLMVLAGTIVSQPLDSLKTWYQVGNINYPKWRIKEYFKGSLYRCTMALLGVNIGWFVYKKCLSIL